MKKSIIVEFGVYTIVAITLFLLCESILKLDEKWKKRMDKLIERDTIS